MKKIEIRLFGTPAILADGEPVGFPYKKVEGFLYYLCVKKQITREEAICLLWGDEDEASGRKKLRDAIYQVRKKLNKDIILTAGHTGIALNPACPVSIDWDHVKKGHLGEQKPFLEYFYIKKCLEFEEWVGGIRAMQSEESVKNASGKFREAREKGDMEAVQKYGSLLIKEDPYDEHIYYELMSIYAEHGDYIMAIRLYYDLEKCLKEEMGVEPSRKIRELFQRVFHVKEHMKAVGGPADLPFVGRKKELFSVSEFLEWDPSDPVNCLVVVGEEGVGKTAFLENSLRLAASRQMVTLKSSCYRQGTDFFLNPWSDILQELRQIQENRGPGFLKTGDEERLSMILKLENAGGPDSRRLTYSMIEREIMELFSGLTRRFRVLLAFDDVQWMDRMSLQLLNRLLGSASGAGTAVLCTCSKNGEMDVMTSLEPLVREDRITVVRLEPFTEEETEEILRRELPDVAKEAGKCRSIYKTTEGNAFFLREMINLIRKKGFTLEKSAKTNLAIQTRLSSVGAREREILECMSVFPEKIGIEELEYLMKGTDRLTLLKRLERLSEAFLIQEVLVGWNVYYKFSHRLFQEYVYEKQSNGKTLQYHRMLAEYYGSQPDRGFRTLALAAYHYDKCHDQVQAYRYQIYYLKEFYTVINENFPVLHSPMPEQGDDFGVMTGAERMLELAEQVIGLKDDSPMIRQMKMEMRYIKGRYEIAMGEYDRGNSDINCSMALALGLGDDEVYLACLKQQIFCGIQTGNTELVEELVEHGLRCRGGEKKDEYATLMRLKGLCYMQKGKYDVAETMLLQALSLFEELDHEIYGAGVAACYNYLGDVYRKQDHLDEAMAYYGRALAVGESLSFMNGLGQIYSSMGQVHCLRGQYKEAMALLEKAVECLERNGYRWGLERAEGWLALTCIKTGDLKSAREHYRKGREISDKIRNPETERLLSEVEKRLENRLTY